MEQNKLESDDLIIDSNVNSLIITKKYLKKESPCFNCGICYNSCPMGLNPLHLEKKEVRDKCLQCGLCSFMCPSNILVHKKEVKINE